MMFNTSRGIALVCFLVVLAAAPSHASLLTGFKLQKLGDAHGFLTSVAVDANGNLYYSVTTGEVYRLDGASSTKIVTIPTSAVGNEALLGIAFLPDGKIAAHWVLPDSTADVIGYADPSTGQVTELARFYCLNGQPCNSEHHGGNIALAPDGGIIVGFGDYGGQVAAQDPNSPGGKIWHVAMDGRVIKFANGFRNPYDLAFDPPSGKIIISDNGPEAGDEINLVFEGANCGWPRTWGNEPPVDGMLAPTYVFPVTVAPTGLVRTNGKGEMREGSVVVSGFVTKALYYFPPLTNRPSKDPIVLMQGLTSPLIDVIQQPTGELIVGSTNAIYELDPPRPGDCNSDGRVRQDDFDALGKELVDGDTNETWQVQNGSYTGSWGCDANEDGWVDTRDVVALSRLLHGRPRGIKHP